MEGRVAALPGALDVCLGSGCSLRRAGTSECELRASAVSRLRPAALLRAQLKMENVALEFGAQLAEVAYDCKE